MIDLNRNKKKVFVGVSGGVDSSVAALLLKKQGFEVFGGFIKGYNLDGCQDKEAEIARKVCQQLDIPFYIFDFEKEYKEKIVDYLIDGYKKGITPNPDILCNSQIKFGLFFDAVQKMGVDFVASGHYADIKLIKKISFKKPFIKKYLAIFEAKDKSKDQSYFLWDVPKEKFEKIIFPLGSIKKSKVRKIAKKNNLINADKKDSQGVCFLGKFKFDDFLRKNIEIKRGDIIDMAGKKIGEHDGAWFYTIGQKHGFNNFAGKEFYVVKKDLEKNLLIASYKGDGDLLCKNFSVSKINFLDDGFKNEFLGGKKIKVFVRSRYRQKPFLAFLSKTDKDKAVVELKKETEVFPASGQSAVFYKKNGQMLGGGIIE